MIKIINDLFKRFITGLSGDIVDTSDESLGKDSPNHDGQVSETEYAGLEPNFSLDTLKDIKKKVYLSEITSFPWRVSAITLWFANCSGEGWWWQRLPVWAPQTTCKDNLWKGKHRGNDTGWFHDYIHIIWEKFKRGHNNHDWPKGTVVLWFTLAWTVQTTRLCQQFW